MAGDWIKMRPALLTSPKVNGIARALEDNREVTRALSTGFNGGMREIVTRAVMRHVTVSALLIVWGAANEHTEDGVFRNADLSDIDDMAGIPGFGVAMETVGWAAFNEEEFTVTLPNFNEYNTCGKDRTIVAKTPAERQKEYRERKKRNESVTDGSVTPCNKSDVTSNHREEKSRQEGKPPKSPKGDSSPAIEFKTFIADCKQRGEKAIADYRPVFEYAEKVGLPDDFVQLAWYEFGRQFGEGGVKATKRQKDWRQTFRNYVEKGYLKLWWLNGDAYELTTAGKQAQRANAERLAA